jgi:hypothetical protein
VVTSEGDGQTALLGMVSNNLSDRLCDARHQARVLHFSDGLIFLSGDLFKLIMSVEMDRPVKGGELLNEASRDKVDWPVINTSFGLDGKPESQNQGEGRGRVRWSPT